MTAEIERIRAALADATYGPWTGAGPSFGKSLPEYLDSVVQDIDGDDCAPTVCRDTETADAEYIAACNPEAMAAVLEFIDQQTTRHAEELAAYELTVANLRERNEELIAACVAAELRAQPERKLTEAELNAGICPHCGREP